MISARCISEIYQVSCKCGEKYLIDVEPQETFKAYDGKIPIVTVVCPFCGESAEFLGRRSDVLTKEHIVMKTYMENHP